MGELLQLNKHQPIITADSINRLKESLLNGNCKDILQKLYDNSFDPIQTVLILDNARLRGYTLNIFDDEEPPKSYA